MIFETLFVQAIGFSVLAVGGIVLLSWWLYFSRLPAGPAAVTAPAGVGRALALLIGVGAFSISAGGYWDASEHIVTGIVPGGDDFLWPPHLMIYAGFLIAFVVAAVGLYMLARPNLAAGVRDPRRWVRGNPYVGAMAVAAAYGLLSVPGDAIWHELYGLDLTAWSPPHIFLVLASSSVPLFAAGLLLRSGRGAGARDTGAWMGLVVLVYLVLAFSELLLIATLEWEIGYVTGFVAERPIWLYPVLIGAFAFLVLGLAQRLLSMRWAATILALLFFGWRLGITSWLLATGGAPPRVTLVFLLGAVLLDLYDQRWGDRFSGLVRSLQRAALFTLGYGAVALPMMGLVYGAFLPPVTVLDHALAVVVTLVICTALQPLIDGLADWMRSDGSAETDTVGYRPVPSASAAD